MDPVARKASNTIRTHRYMQQLLASDLGVLEARFLAKIDKIMRDDSIEDKHRATAAVVFSVDPEDVTEAMRRRGKAINLGLAYHMPVEVLTRVANGEAVA